MLDGKDRLLKSSRWVVALVLVANRLFLVAVVAGLALSWVFSTRFAVLLVHEAPRVDARSEMVGLRWLMVLGVVMGIATEVLLATLARILASARIGEAFLAANARRLRTIGWALLTLQLLDLPGALIARSFPSLGSAAPDISVSPGGWLAVLMMFVLSRVFAAGSAMKADLEGTV